MSTYGYMIERYCPILKRNVPVEVSYQQSGVKHERCMQKHFCMQVHGGCAGFDQQN